MLNTIKDILVISIGAIFGANARWVISRYLAKAINPFFPYGTLVINVSGSFAVGFFVIWATERTLLDPRWRLLIVVGFCGAFTTFSSFMLDTLSLAEGGSTSAAFANVAGQTVLGLAVTFAAYRLFTS